MIFQAVLWLLLAQSAAAVEHLEQQAHVLIEGGNYSEAQKRLQQATRIEPRSAALWNELGKVDAQLGQVKPAIAAFEKALSLGPESPNTCFQLAALYARAGAPDKALDLYRRGLRHDPYDPVANQSYGLLLMKAGDFSDALVPLLKLKSGDTTDATVRMALIECYFASGKMEDGANELQEFLNSPSISQPDQLQLVRALVKDGLADPAQQVLEHIVMASPDSAGAHGDLGLLLASKNRFEDAVYELGRAAQLVPGSPDYNLWLGEALLDWGHFPVAVNFLLAVKERFGNLPEYHYELARGYYGLKRRTMAIAELEPLSQAHPEVESYHLLLGACYLEVGDNEKAEAQFRQALRINPDKASSYAALGEVLRREGPQKTDEAIGYLKKALRLNPSDTESKLSLALCYQEKPDLPTARRLLEEVVRADPDSLVAHRVLARIYYQLGNKSEGDKETGLVAQLEAKQREHDAEHKRERLQLQQEPTSTQ